MKNLYLLVDKDGNFAQSWSKPNKIPVFRSESAAKKNMKHYRGEGLRIVKYVPIIEQVKVEIDGSDIPEHIKNYGEGKSYVTSNRVSMWY